MVTIAPCMSLILVLGVTADAGAATDIVVATGDTEVRVEAANDLLQISSLKYDPLSNRQAFYDASYALPPAMCECYVEQRPGKTPANFLYMLRSGMMGWCTMMTDLSRWTPGQKSAARRQFEVYKQRLRPLIQHGNLYHVSERPDGRRWDGIEYYHPADGRGVLFAFRGTTAERSHPFRFKGLEPAARYRLVCEDASIPPCVMTGRQLMETGLTVVLTETESSELVHLARAP